MSRLSLALLLALAACPTATPPTPPCAAEGGEGEGGEGEEGEGDVGEGEGEGEGEGDVEPVVEHVLPALHRDGDHFVDDAGDRVDLFGAVICCERAKERGWPLVDDDTLALFAAHRVNLTHVRLGPNTVLSEGPEFVAYAVAGENVVDLDDWNPAFWARLRALVQEADRNGIYVELSLIDAWVLERPELSAWAAGNNVNGVDVGHCDVLREAPPPVHQRWLEKIAFEVGEFDNVLFEIGNETFDCDGALSSSWEEGAAAILRAALSANGFAQRPIGTNSHDAAVEGAAAIDYVNVHVDDVVGVHAGKPTAVNEYGDTLGADEFAARLRSAHARGTAFYLWRADQSDEVFVDSLGRIAAFRDALDAGVDVVADPGFGCGAAANDECGAAEGPAGVYGCCFDVDDRGSFGDVVDAAIGAIIVERPELFDGDRVVDEDGYVRGVAAILQRDHGLCAKQGGPSDEIGVKADNGRNEQYDILLSSGEVRYGGHVVDCVPARF